MPTFRRRGLLLAAALFLLCWFFSCSGCGRSSALPPLRANDGTLLVHVPEGTFWMGSDAAAAENDEGPLTLVRVRAFYLAASPVTNAQYARFLSQAPAARIAQYVLLSGPGAPLHDITVDTSGQYRVRAGRESCPVVGVNWYGAVAYCDWAGLRLPGEAEWEYAARDCGKRWPYPWGDAAPEGRANFGRVWSDLDQPPPITVVDRYPASPLGLYDLAGNTWEWTSSLYAYYPYDARDGREDLQAEGKRVVRGGSWHDGADGVRVTRRVGYRPELRATWFSAMGFRCARDLQAPTTPPPVRLVPLAAEGASSWPRPGSPAPSGTPPARP